MNTLFTKEEIFLDGRLVIGKKLQITLHEDFVEVYKDGYFIEKKPLTSSFEKRLAVIELIKNYGAMKTRVSEAFKISRQSIDNWLDNYSKYGAEGLINNTKDSWKKNPKRFKGNKARELEKDRFLEAQKKESQEITIDFNVSPRIPACVNTDLYSDNYPFEDNRYSGSMLVIGMIEYLFGFSLAIANLYEEDFGFMFLFSAMHINQISSIEQLKLVHKHEFGRIVGKEKLPSLPNLWKSVHSGVQKQKSEILHGLIFDNQIKQGHVGLNELHVDGHFIPYYGKEKVHKGYFTQRDMMIKGQTQMFVHDASGRVVYFETHEGKGNIVEVVKQTSHYVSLHNQGLKPLIAIDREVWGVKNFIYLSQERVVSWEKYCNQTDLQAIDIKMFDSQIEKNGKSWLLAEDQKEYTDSEKNSVTLRRIIMHNKENEHRLCAVTTDSTEDKSIIAETMLNRWGSNENTFKYMGTRTKMHYNPVIEISKESDKQEIDNPEYKKTHKKLSEAKSKLSRDERKLGKKPITQNQDGKLRKNQHRDQLQKSCLLKKQEIQQLTEQLKTIPQRIDVSEIDEQKFKVIDNEGINLWAISESIFWNSRKELIEQFSKYLPNPRDTIPVLEALIKAKGRIKCSEKMILVKLETLQTPRYKSAQIQLLRYINNLGCHINGKILQFDIMSN